MMKNENEFIVHLLLNIKAIKMEWLSFLTVVIRERETAAPNGVSWRAVISIK